MSDIRTAINYIRAGKKGEARQILANILKNDRNNEEAWLYMASCARTKQEYAQCLQRVLELNPNNKMALKLAARDNVPLPDNADVFVDPHVTLLSDSTGELEPNPTVTPSQTLKAGHQSRRWWPIILILLLVIGLGVGIVALLFESSGTSGSDNTRETQAALIGATNSFWETSVAQQAADQQSTLGGPTREATISPPELAQRTVAVGETATAIVRATALAITPTISLGQVQNGPVLLVERVRQGETTNAEIVLVRGEEIINLTKHPEDDEMPAWSPDGRTIAFVSYRDGNAEIYTMAADGSDVRRLTTTPDAEEVYPSWSPDGVYLVFASDRDGDMDIYTIRSDGEGEVSQLTSNDAIDSYPTWSSDNRLAFASNRDGNFEVYKMDSNGSNLQRLTENNADDFSPAWSPDSKQLVFVTQSTSTRDISRINADGTSLVNLTNSPENEFGPAWSPDGTLIIYALEQEEGFAIYTMQADGSEPEAFLIRDTSLDSPVWSASQ